MQVYVSTDSPLAIAEDNLANAKGTKRGELCVIDFFTQMALEGRVFQIRAGSVSSPLVGDVTITDQVAEWAIEAPLGLTILPCYLNVALNLHAATLAEICAKSRAWTTAITFTTAFVPLPLYIGGPQSMARAFLDAAGGVDVGAGESLTLDRLHYSWSQPIAAGAWTTTLEWKPLAPPPIAGRSIFYVQIGADTTGPSYFATNEYIELPTINLS